MKPQIKKIIVGIIILLALFFVLAVVYSRVQSNTDKQLIKDDLTQVAKSLELFKSDSGSYPNEEELKTFFGSNQKYSVNVKNHSGKYLGGLAMDNNFFYCVQNNPNKYVLLAVKDYDYAEFLTEGINFHSYNAPQNRSSDYPFHVHNTAAGDICPKFLPGFTSSSMGSTLEDGWASWTGIQ
jgi:hypothetical protein